MRLRALTLSLFALLLAILAGCNSTGIPESSATPTALSVRPTATDVALANPTSTRAGSRPTSTSRPRTTPTAGPAETPVPSGTQTAENLRIVEQIKKDIADFRGLELKEEVPIEFVSQQQIAENLAKEQAEDYPPEEAKRDAVELWLMRLVEERDFDINQLMIDLLGEQVIGYYHIKKDELFVSNQGEELSPTARETLAHELVHALQDQYYDLEKLQPQESTDDDAVLAARSLVEGDASIAGLLYAQQYMTPEEYQSILDESANADSEVLDRAPRYFRDSLYFPYTDGVNFVFALGILGGFEPVDEALVDPPVSSEQIMHPDKYLNKPRDLPKPAPMEPLTDTLGAGWTYNDGGTLGEFDLKILLEENGAVDGSSAAAGWGGAVYEFYLNGDEALFAINTVWDTRRDANEFEEALDQTFTSYEKDGDILKDPDGQRFFSVKRVGDRIVLAASTDRAALERAMGAVK